MKEYINIYLLNNATITITIILIFKFEKTRLAVIIAVFGLLYDGNQNRNNIYISQSLILHLKMFFFHINNNQSTYHMQW